MPRMKEDELLQHIIKYIDVLEYPGMETLEPSWVQSVLLTAGGARLSLLMWVLGQFSPAEAAEVQALPQSLQLQRILQTLSSFGVCRPGDTEIIEGNAPPGAQYRFWLGCLESIYNLRRFPPLPAHQHSESYAADSLMDQMSHSPHLQLILKEGGVNVVPGDQREKYRAWYKYSQRTPVSESLEATEEKLRECQKMYEATDNRWKAESPSNPKELQTKVCSSIADLCKQQELLQGVYSAYIAPWTTSTQQLELPNTGPLIHEANTKLATLTKVLKATQDASDRCEELSEREKAIMRHSTQPSSVTSTLHALVSPSNVNAVR
ncbi:uncharacterized protein LOC122265389 [Penaeus japonicus]|uniref:uncharacterized protein LOC122265389 n=1 Tax=Penaeus japonicus TaxID=27405 RepID=UPI001C716893|nr:uncharacterized protein LOC122265389 [Penaeus japonicus]